MNGIGEQIQTVIDRMKAKLQTLCLPLCVVDDEEVGPLPSEIAAATELMRWMTGHVQKWTELLQSEPTRRRQMWPNVHIWQGLITALKGLPRCPEIDYQQAHTALLAACRKMMQIAPGAAQQSKAQQSPFLPKESQRMAYKECVRRYHDQFLANSDLMHKELMLHWAAIYHAIARNTGIEHLPFQGPAFDNFIYNYCGIAYNKSTTPRGRYRTIDDVLTKCLTELETGKHQGEQSAQTRTFVAARNEMKRLLNAGNHRPSDASARVPQSPFK